MFPFTALIPIPNFIISLADKAPPPQNRLGEASAGFSAGGPRYCFTPAECERRAVHVLIGRISWTGAPDLTVATFTPRWRS